MKHIDIKVELKFKFASNIVYLVLNEDTDWTNTTVNNLLIMIEDLSSSFLVSDCLFESYYRCPLLFEFYGCFQASASGRLTILSQFDTGSIIVRHIKCITARDIFALIVYRPIKFTHNASQRILRTSLVGNLPYLVLYMFRLYFIITCIERLLFGKIYTACICRTDVTHRSPIIAWFKISCILGLRVSLVWPGWCR
jgi:hypothetical protein